MLVSVDGYLISHTSSYRHRCLKEQRAARMRKLQARLIHDD